MTVNNEFVYLNFIFLLTVNTPHTFFSFEKSTFWTSKTKKRSQDHFRILYKELRLVVKQKKKYFKS